MTERTLPATSRHTQIVDVHLLLRREGQVLLSRRAGTGYADGLLHAPSGHVEHDEDVRAALLREAEEEVGLVLRADQVSVALVMQHRAPDGGARIGWFFEAWLEAGQEPVNAEPDKCAGIGWYALDRLPQEMVAYCRAGLEAYLAGERFALHWHQPTDPIAHDPALPSRLVSLPSL